MHYTILHYTTRYDVTLDYCAIQLYTKPKCTILHCATLHYTTPEAFTLT